MLVYTFLMYYLSINIGSLALLLKNYPENNSHYYVTSSKIRESHNEILRKLQEGYVNFKITLEPHFEIELHIKNRISNIFDQHTTFKSFDDNKFINLEKSQLQQTVDALVDGFVHKESNSSCVIGYIKRNNFYGTVDISEGKFFIVDIKTNKDLSDKFKNTSYNAIVYKTGKNTENPYEISPKTKKSKRSIVSSKDLNLFQQLIGNG